VEEILIFLGAIVLVFLPALALTMRITIRPLVEALIRLREGWNAPSLQVPPHLEQRLNRMETELGDVGRAVERLGASLEFDRQLRGGDEPRQPLPPLPPDASRG
jgi:HAMP domain-containing protein